MNSQLTEQEEAVYLFTTTSGVSILATLESFYRYWHTYILDRGEAYTWQKVSQ